MTIKLKVSMLHWKLENLEIGSEKVINDTSQVTFVSTFVSSGLL